MLDKTFHTYRKSKGLNKWSSYKWHPLNLVNKHQTRQGDQVRDLLDDGNVIKKIYQSRPDLVLSVGNEYLTLMLMEELGSKYLFSISCHFYIFIK